MDTESKLIKLFKIGYILLGILSAIGLIGYGLSYIVVMPKVSPDAFVPKALNANTSIPSWFGIIQPMFVLLYSFALLPVIIMFTIKKIKFNPYALVLACCLMVVSLIIEIFNSLPIISLLTYPVKLTEVSPDVRLYISQIESIKFLSFDVAGFSIAYAAIFIYAIVYFRENKLLSYSVFLSILLFILNVPFVWFAPSLAVILMAFSVLAFAMVPIILAKMAIE